MGGTTPITRTSAMSLLTGHSLVTAPSSERRVRLSGVARLVGQSRKVRPAQRRQARWRPVNNPMMDFLD